MQFFRNIPFALIILVLATSLIGAQTPPSGIITTYAGSGITYNCSAFHTAPDCPQIGAYGFKGDGGPATSALLFNPGGIAVDATGNLFMADTNNNRIRKVTRDGVISTVAGNGQPGFSGDGGPATAAELNQPEAVAVDAVGNLFIADWGNHRIRKVIRPAVSAPSEPGLIFTIAGNGQSGFSGDGGPATQASLSTVLGLALDAAGDVFIADTGNSRIREVTPDGLINTVAGNGTFGFSGDGGSANSASLNYPYGIAIDAAGNLLIADHGNNSIRKVTPDGVISSIGVISSDGVGIQQPTAITVDILGNLLVSENERNMVWEVSPAGVAFVVAGGTGGPPAGDGGPAISAALNSPNGVALNAQGDLFIDDSGNSRIRKVTAVAAGGLFLTLEDFVTGLYVNALGREPDPGGRSSWVSLLLSPLTGCNAEGFATVAEGFFDDMYSPPLSLTQLVTVLYRTFLLRAPDPDGLAWWTNAFRQARLNMVLQGFIASSEFKSLFPNRTDPRQMTLLVTRLYQQALGRAPDPGELNAWVSFIVSTQNIEAAVTAFLVSPEFESRALTLNDYINVLYLALLGRYPNGVEGYEWKQAMRHTLLQVIDDGFAASGEFQAHLPQMCARPSSSIVVFVSPANVILKPGATQLFTATVTGTSNTAVIWTVSGSNGGTISANGQYTAPASLPVTSRFYFPTRICATSVADASKGGCASVDFSTR